MATEKQIRYALLLMQRAGYRTEWMSAEHKRLGASMRERQGRVEDWLKTAAPRVIDQLKAGDVAR